MGVKFPHFIFILKIFQPPLLMYGEMYRFFATVEGVHQNKATCRRKGRYPMSWTPKFL